MIIRLVFQNQVTLPYNYVGNNILHDIADYGLHDKTMQVNIPVQFDHLYHLAYV